MTSKTELVAIPLRNATIAAFMLLDFPENRSKITGKHNLHSSVQKQLS